MFEVRMENKVSDNKVIWISYKDDAEQIVTGFVILLEMSETFVKIQNNKNVLVIPMHRVLKIKFKGSE